MRSSATPRRASSAPIFGIFSEYVIGLKDYGELIKDEDAEAARGPGPGQPGQALPRLPPAGRWPAPTAPEKHLLRIRIKGKYPQWKYWMPMTFIAPVPWEADAFYAQPGMAEQRPVAGHWPVGTGPVHDDRVRQGPAHVMKRNPNYRGEPYPVRRHAGRHGRPGCSTTAASRMPFVDTLVVDDREARRRRQRSKFRRATTTWRSIERTDYGRGLTWSRCRTPTTCSADYEEQGLQASRSMTDVTRLVPRLQHARPGGRPGRHAAQQAERNRKLRQAISIAIDWDEYYGKIFPKKGGETAHEPAAAGHVRLARRHARGRTTRSRTSSSTARSCAARSRRRKQAAGRGRLPRRPRRQDRHAAGAQLRLLRAAHARAQARDRLGGQAVRQDRHPARGPRHRQQPVPGQGAQGQAPGLLARLERRLPRRRELPVPALRPELQERVRRREHRELRRTPSTTSSSRSCKTSTTARRSRPSSTRWCASCSRTRRGQLRLLPLRVGGLRRAGSTTPSRRS